MDKDFWNDVAGPKWVRDQYKLDAMLAPHAEQVLAIAALNGDHRVVDVGCGTGALTLAAADIAASAVGVDVSRPMLARAKERALERTSSATFLQSDAATYEMPAGSIDRILSRFGVMFFDDPTAAFKNMHRWLAPRGSVSFVCWQSPEENAWLSEPARLVAPFNDAPPSDPSAPGPFSLSDPINLYMLLGNTQFRNIEIDEFRTPIVVKGDLQTAVNFFKDRSSVAQALEKAPSPEPILEVIQTFAKQHHNGTELTMETAAWVVTASV